MAASPRPRVARRLRSLITVAAAIGAATVGLTAPAHAATPNPMAHPERDYMGSTVAAHEHQTGVTPLAAPGGLPGLDVSHYQGTINWTTVKNQGAQFAYIKATEGTTYRDPNFSANYTNAYYAGLVRGAYHFAQPASSTGAAQADYFAAHGGAWSADNQTLPGMLDIEYNPNGATCYGLSQASMRTWITSFLNEYHAKTGRWATIYTTTDWWTTCTGNTSAYASNDPLAIARYSSSVGTLPAGWGFYTFWQWADSGTFPGDQDVFNGAHDRLIALANNTP
ncbi:GH25 family lysozyme [Actinoallomurus acaciae]|uniref:Lysozyme n=1 Tax=Actinoallomurus acaciae TaxID=502577 RepID=A0ABV5YTB3_9ACTN